LNGHMGVSQTVDSYMASQGVAQGFGR